MLLGTWPCLAPTAHLEQPVLAAADQVAVVHLGSAARAARVAAARVRRGQERLRGGHANRTHHHGYSASVSKTTQARHRCCAELH